MTVQHPEQPIERRQPERNWYSEEDVKAILERATGVQGKTFTRIHLEEMAADLDVSLTQLQAAEEEFFDKQNKANDDSRLDLSRHWRPILIMISSMLIMLGTFIVVFLAYLTGTDAFLTTAFFAAIFTSLIFFMTLVSISES